MRFSTFLYKFILIFAGFVIFSGYSKTLNVTVHHKEEEYNCTYKFFSSSDFTNEEKCKVSTKLCNYFNVVNWISVNYFFSFCFLILIFNYLNRSFTVILVGKFGF